MVRAKTVIEDGVLNGEKLSEKETEEYVAQLAAYEADTGCPYPMHITCVAHCFIASYPAGTGGQWVESTGGGFCCGGADFYGE